MKKTILLFMLFVMTLTGYAQTCTPVQTTTCSVSINPDSTYKREYVLGYEKRYQDIQTFALYQLHEAADTIGMRAGWTADIRHDYQEVNMHAYDTLGHSSTVISRTDQYGAYGNINANSANSQAIGGIAIRSDELRAINTTSASTNSMQSMFQVYADEVTQSNTKALMRIGNVTGLFKGISIDINPSFTGPRFLYTESNLTGVKRGMGYAATGYVTQLHSFADKEYSDLSIIMPFTKTSLPSAALPNRIIFVTNATGGACPAYNDGTNWRRFSDNSIIN